MDENLIIVNTKVNLITKCQKAVRFIAHMFDITNKGMYDFAINHTFFVRKIKVWIISDFFFRVSSGSQRSCLVKMEKKYFFR